MIIYLDIFIILMILVTWHGTEKKKSGVSGKINKIVSGNDVMKFISKHKLFCCWIQGAIDIHNNLKKPGYS